MQREACFADHFDHRSRTSRPGASDSITMRGRAFLGDTAGLRGKCVVQQRAAAQRGIVPRTGTPCVAAAQAAGSFDHKQKRHTAIRTDAVAARGTDWAPGQHSELAKQATSQNGNGQPRKHHGPPLANSVQGVILAGGSADNPLARYRAMPAVELGANTNLIDIPISNCIRSGINKMFVLTQFNSHLLNTHIASNYPPAVFGSANVQGFVDVLAATQTPESQQWYKGSADAVRRNLPMLLEPVRGRRHPQELLVLSGQALYRMDFADMINTHRKSGADITIATHTVGWGQAQLRGLARVGDDGRVLDFVEKPSGEALKRMANHSMHATEESPFEASMGVYVFKTETLVRLLQENEDKFGSSAGPDTHFGHDVIPHALRDGLKVINHYFDGYWREISSLRDFYEVNLELAMPGAPVSIYDVDETIVSRGQILPPAIIHSCELEHTLVGEGSVLVGSTIKNCVIGCNSYVGQGAHLEASLIMGNDNYTNDKERKKAREAGNSVLGIGEGSFIKGAIIDDNAAIGHNVRIENRDGVKEADRTQEGYVIQDGIVVVLRGAIIPDKTVI